MPSPCSFTPTGTCPATSAPTSTARRSPQPVSTPPPGRPSSCRAVVSRCSCSSVPDQPAGSTGRPARRRGRRRPGDVARRRPARHPGAVDRPRRGGRRAGCHRGRAPRALPLHRPACGAPREAADPARAGPRRSRPRRGRARGRHRRGDQPGGSHRARPGQRPTRPPHGIRHGGRRGRAGCAVRLRGRVVRQGPAHRARLRRHPRRERRQHRGAAHGQAALPARRRADRAPRAGRQGDHVRLRRHQHQAL